MKRLTIGLLLLSTMSLFGKNSPELPGVLAQVDSLILNFQYEAAEKFITQALVDSTVLTPEIRTRLLNRVSEIRLKRNDSEAAMEYGLKAMAEAINSNDRLVIAEAQVSIINAQQVMGQILDVPEQTMKLFNLANAHKSPGLLRSAHSIEGYHMMNIQDFEKAHLHFSKALQISQKNLSPNYIIYDLLVLGFSCIINVKLDSAILLVGEAEMLSSQSGDSIMLAKSLMTKCYLSLIMGNIEESKRLAHAAERLSISLNLPLVTAQTMKQRMTIEMMERNFKPAIALGLEAVALVEYHPNQIHRTVLDSLLYVCYANLGEHQRALFHFSRYNQSILTIYQKHKAYQIKQLEYLQAIQAKEDDLEKQKLLYLSERRKTNTFILLNLLVVSLAAGILYFFTQRQRHRRNLFFKEQMISGLMEESEIRRTVRSDVIASAGFSDEEEEAPDEEDNELTELSLQKRKALYDQLLQLMENEKLYLDPTMDRNTLVILLGTNRKYLYEALKYVGNTNINHLLNRYRVFEAKKIIHEQCRAGHQDLPDNIFSRAGFTAKTTYYRTFKKFTGITPLEYALEYFKNIQSKNFEGFEPDEGD